MSRRSAIALAALGGLGTTGLAGCSRLPGIPGLGGAGAPDVLDRVDPSAAAQSPLLSFAASRPAAIAEVLELGTESAPWGEQLGLKTLFHPTDPLNMVGIGGQMNSAERGLEEHLMVPSAAVSVMGAVGAGGAVWEDGAEVLDHLEKVLAGRFVREGDELRIDPSAPDSEFSAIRVIAAHEDDLVFTGAEDPSAFVDTGTGLPEAFADLDGLFAAIDIREPHLSAGAFVQKELSIELETGTLTEWAYATEIVSQEEQTTRGAIRADGGLEELRTLVLDMAQQRDRPGLRVTEADIDGDLLRVTVTAGEEGDLPDLSRLSSFYVHMREVPGPGVPIVPE